MKKRSASLVVVAVLAVPLYLLAQTFDGGSLRQTQQQFYENITVRAASGDLTAGESTTAITGTGAFSEAILQLNVTTLTTADGDDEVDFYFQTSYDGGTTWVDLENVHFANADNGTTPTRLILLGPLAGVTSSDTAATPTDGTLADNTKVKLPLGGRLRIKTAVTGATAPTYAYNVVGMFR